MQGLTLPREAPDVTRLALQKSAVAGVDARTVRSRALLNLLRFDSVTASTAEIVANEIGLSVDWVAARCRHEQWRLQGAAATRLESDHAHFHALDSEVGARVIANFHFLGYARVEGTYFGVSVRQGKKWQLAAVASLSPLDLEYLRPLLGSAAQEALIITRLYSFPWAPRNTLSFLLGQLRQRVRRAGLGALLVTFCNPNAGHLGSTYRAAGWWVFARQRQFSLSYLDGQYISVREAQAVLPSEHHRLSTSQQPLQDLLLFCRTVTDAGNAAFATPPHMVDCPVGREQRREQ